MLSQLNEFCKRVHGVPTFLLALQQEYPLTILVVSKEQ